MKKADYEHAGNHRRLTYVTREKPEKKRVYLFPGGDTVTIENVVEAKASRHGNHQLTTTTGEVHVIPWGWICLTFPAEAQVVPEEVKPDLAQPGKALP